MYSVKYLTQRSTIWRSLFGDHPITSPLMSPTSTTPTPLRSLPSTSPTPFTNNTHHPLQPLAVISSDVNTSQTHSAFNTVNTPQSTTPANGHHSQSQVGPPPMLGFVPRNLFAKNSSSSCQKTSLSHQSTNDNIATSNYQVENRSSIEGTPNLHASPLHNYQSNPMSHDVSHDQYENGVQFRTPLRRNKLESPAHQTSVFSSSNDVNMQNLPISTANNELTSSFTFSPSLDSSSTNSSTFSRTRSWTMEATKDKKKTDYKRNTIHYDHRNGTLSGSVFDEGVWPGSEFDQLRSEPSLLT